MRKPVLPEKRSLLRTSVSASSSLVTGRRRYARAMLAIADIGRLYGGHLLRRGDDLSAVHRQAAERLVHLCRANGAIWVKAAQFFSCRPDVLPLEYITALQSLQNEARPVGFRKIDAELAEALGPDWRQHFREFDPQPAATASIAQVHRAVLADGRRVAVKVRLPGVVRLFRQDVRVFRLLSRLLAPLFKELDFVQITEQLIHMTTMELDFRNEAQNLVHFARLEHPPRIRTPVLVPHLSRSAVMVTEWVDGERLRDYLDNHRDEAADLLGLLFASYLYQVTRAGLYQADPHPGNFLVSEDRTITILDFGTIGRLSQGEVKRYSRLLYGLMGFEGQVDVGQLFVDAGFVGGNPDTLRELALYVLSDRLKNANPATAMTDLLEKFRENHVYIPDSYIGIARVLITLGGFLMHYDVPFDWTPPEQRPA